MPVVIQRQVPMTLKVQKSVEVARVIPHERLLRPAGGGSSVRERAKRFETEWGAKHMATVEGPRNIQGDEQREDLESNLEQDACASVDESLGGLSLTDPRPEAADAELASWEKQLHAGEMILTAGDYERARLERRRRGLSSGALHGTTEQADDSSDQVAKSVDDSTELEISKKKKNRRS